MTRVLLDSRKKELLRRRLIRINNEGLLDPDFPDKGKVDIVKSRWKNYSLMSPLGQIVYESFSDEELLSVLRKSAEILNHSPTQKEIFWVFCDYIKKRFGKWPYALKLAGLSKGAGSGGMTYEETLEEKEKREKLLKELRERTVDMGHIPHPHQVQDISTKLKKYYPSWGEALRAANIDTLNLAGYKVYKIDDLEQEYVDLLAIVEEKAYDLGRSPMHTEIEAVVKKPLLNRCGSWRNVLYQLGLEPVIRKRPFERFYLDYRSDDNRAHHNNSLHNCLYKLVGPSDEVKSALAKVENIIEETGTVPAKEDVDDSIRRILIDACGSWPNVLFQIGIESFDKEKRK